MGIRLLHVADMHLGRAFKQLGPAARARRQDLVDTFRHICDEALREQVTAVLIAGDLFDTSRPLDDLVAQVRANLDRLGAAGIRVLIIPGNHDDIWQPGSVWSSHPFPNAHVFSEATFTQAPSFDVAGTTIRVHGVAYNHTICLDPLNSLRRSGDGVNIAMIHGTVNPPAGFPVEQRYFPANTDALRSTGMDYVALGHIHKQRIFKDGTRSFASYPGSPEGLDPTETGERYVALLDFAGGSPDIQLLAVNKRTVRGEQLNVTSCSMEDIVERLKRLASKDSLLTLTLSGIPDAVPDVKSLQRLAEDGFFWLNILDATEIVRAEWVEKIAVENTIRGQFVRNMQERIELATGQEQRATLELALKLGLGALQRRSAA